MHHTNSSGPFNKKWRREIPYERKRIAKTCCVCAHQSARVLIARMHRRALKTRLNEHRTNNKIHLHCDGFALCIHHTLRVDSYQLPTAPLSRSLVSTRVPSPKRKSLRVSSMNWKNSAREKLELRWKSVRSVVEHDFSALHKLRYGNALLSPSHNQKKQLIDAHFYFYRFNSERKKINLPCNFSSTPLTRK